MGGSRRVARLAFLWGMVACGGAISTASAQEAKKPEPAPKANVIQAAPQSHSPSWQTRSTAPWIPQRFQSVRQDQPLENAMKLSDQHTIVVSTLVLILAGVIVLLLVL
jgi:hypothetical protein